MFFFFVFRHEERLAKAGGEEDLERYNLRLRGFPNAFYAKMLGKRPFRPQAAEAEQVPPAGT